MSGFEFYDEERIKKEMDKLPKDLKYALGCLIRNELTPVLNSEGIEKQNHIEAMVATLKIVGIMV